MTPPATEKSKSLGQIARYKLELSNSFSEAAWEAVAQAVVAEHRRRVKEDCSLREEIRREPEDGFTKWFYQHNSQLRTSEREARQVWDAAKEEGKS